MSSISLLAFVILVTIASARVVNDVPTGPSKPHGGWHVVFADAFKVRFGSGPGQDPLWHANRWAGNYRQPGFNSDEVEVFDPSQVTFGPEGVRLTAKYERNAGGEPHKNYVSGVIQTEYKPYPGGGPSWDKRSPFPASSIAAPKGFHFTVGTGVTWAFELVMTSAPNGPSRGNDIGWWAPGDIEIDFFEYWGYDPDISKTMAGTGAVLLWYENGNNPPGYGGEQHIPELYDHTKPHRYTTVVYPDLSSSLWIDGKKVKMQDARRNYAETYRTKAPPSYKPSTMPIMISFGLRDIQIDATSPPPKGYRPPYFTDSRTLTVHSVAVYQDGAHAGQGFSGGGVAPGTVVAKVKAAPKSHHKKHKKAKKHKKGKKHH